ncbi:LOW QUALITY PROTEIN: DNA excision repair protein ERCC-8-like [Babylonia areolata]|uniref:LOW QUALITY PROTEIN: DNA excision repair protein ERCC-8-like n=1 Tax=Babylonia areolata TaxID=304850 RepID=UPI003FD00D98
MSPVARKHSLVAVGAGRCTVKLVDVRSGSASHQLKGHKASVLSVQWSSRHEFLLASGGLDKKVILWDVRKSKGELMMLDQHRDRQAGSSRCDKTAHNHTINSIHFTPDGLHLVTYGTDHQLHLWDTSFGDLLPVNYGVVENTVKKALQMEVVADCSPALLFVPSNSTIRLYDLFKGEQLTTLSGHYYNVNCCVSHPDSQFLFSGGKDHNLLVWTPHVERDQQDGASSSPKTPAGSAAVTADAWSSDEET